MPKHFLIFWHPGETWLPGKSIFEQPLNDHVNYLEGLYQQGKVVMAGPFVDGTGGMTILKVSGDEEARALAARDPAVVKKAIQPEIREWKPIIPKPKKTT